MKPQTWFFIYLAAFVALWLALVWAGQIVLF